MRHKGDADNEELLEYFGRRAPGGRDTNFCLGASKTGEYQGGPGGALGAAAGSGCLAAPDLGFGPERILGKTDLFEEGLWSLFEESIG